jgi:hypothetical protein
LKTFCTAVQPSPNILSSLWRQTSRRLFEKLSQAWRP